jgi:hypothetical protein
MAIGCALLSLALRVTAVVRWSARAADETAAAERSGWCRGLTLFAVIVLLLVGLLVVSARAGWPRDRALWIGVGTLLALLTLTRPWWFWQNWKARWIRGLIGDAATALSRSRRPWYGSACIRTGPSAANERKTNLIVVTTPSLDGHRITKYLGLVSGEAILGANIFRDLFAGIRDIVGGRSTATPSSGSISTMRPSPWAREVAC